MASSGSDYCSVIWEDPVNIDLNHTTPHIEWSANSTCVWLSGNGSWAYLWWLSDDGWWLDSSDWSMSTYRSGPMHRDLRLLLDDARACHLQEHVLLRLDGDHRRHECVGHSGYRSDLWEERFNELHILMRASTLVRRPKLNADPRRRMT
jgi:hypothetical protein